ncbi:MAG TPA: carboxypeptidase regulatory-like domain-containing protein [Gemmatimonadaceae bacterium]|nr:carboxypeptidase regulatory-like domain-containing protein [Gemmatimonadaceae bacterium]
MTAERRAAVLAVALLVAPATQADARAQTPGVLSGIIRDDAGAPVAQAQLSMSGVRAESDSTGRYRLAGVPAGYGTLHVRRVGFAPVESGVDIPGGGSRILDIYMRAIPATLPGVLTEAAAGDRLRLADFHRHREIGNGFFFDRKEIEAKKALRTSDILRRLPGMRFVADRSGRQQLRMARSNCVPDFWIDGQRAPMLNVDDIPLQDIEALEVYRGESGIPPEFNNRGNRQCGAVVIWTRSTR